MDRSVAAGAEDAAPLPPEQMRPPGAVMLAGVRHSYLWLADCLGRPFILSLRHPGLRARCLAARGELTTARTIAERGEAWGVVHVLDARAGLPTACMRGGSQHSATCFRIASPRCRPAPRVS